MASQGQAVARQQNKWLEPFVVALAIGAILVTLGWGAFTALSAPSTVAPSKTTTQILQEPGLLDQRQGERGGSVVVIPSSESTIMTDGLVEHRLGERAVLSPNRTKDDLYVLPSAQKTGTNGFNGFGNTGYGEAAPPFGPGMVEHRRGEHSALGQSSQTTGTNGFNGFGNTGYDEAAPSLGPGMVEHRRGER